MKQVVLEASSYEIDDGKLLVFGAEKLPRRTKYHNAVLVNAGGLFVQDRLLSNGAPSETTRGLCRFPKSKRLVRVHRLSEKTDTFITKDKDFALILDEGKHSVFAKPYKRFSVKNNLYERIAVLPENMTSSSKITGGIPVSREKSLFLAHGEAFLFDAKEPPTEKRILRGWSFALVEEGKRGLFFIPYIEIPPKDEGEPLEYIEDQMPFKQEFYLSLRFLFLYDEKGDPVETEEKIRQIIACSDGTAILRTENENFVLMKEEEGAKRPEKILKPKKLYADVRKKLAGYAIKSAYELDEGILMEYVKALKSSETDYILCDPHRGMAIRLSPSERKRMFLLPRKKGKWKLCETDKRDFLSSFGYGEGARALFPSMVIHDHIQIDNYPPLTVNPANGSEEYKVLYYPHIGTKEKCMEPIVPLVRKKEGTYAILGSEASLKSDHGEVTAFIGVRKLRMFYDYSFYFARRERGALFYDEYGECKAETEIPKNAGLQTRYVPLSFFSPTEPPERTNTFAVETKGKEGENEWLICVPNLGKNEKRSFHVLRLRNVENPEIYFEKRSGLYFCSYDRGERKGLFSYKPKGETVDGDSPKEFVSKKEMDKKGAFVAIMPEVTYDPEERIPPEVPPKAFSFDPDSGEIKTVDFGKSLEEAEKAFEKLLEKTARLPGKKRRIPNIPVTTPKGRALLVIGAVGEKTVAYEERTGCFFVNAPSPRDHRVPYYTAMAMDVEIDRLENSPEVDLSTRSM